MVSSIQDEFNQGPSPPGYVDTEVIRILRDGTWLADGEEISHEPTRRLFARSIKKDAQGYFLHIGNEYKRIEVDDTPFFVQRIEGTPPKGFQLILSDETEERLEPETLSYQPGRLICRVKAMEEEARFLQSSYIELLRNLQEDERHYFLEISGKRIDLTHK